VRFNRAIVRSPGKSSVNGITTADLGSPSYTLAMQQHRAYVEALDKCGLNVTLLPSIEQFPDSTFVEDTAVLLPDCAVITRPGAETRRGEIVSMAAALEYSYQTIRYIEEPGTLDGGDVLKTKDCFYIGLSDRTNQEGANQLIRILNQYGLSGTTIRLNHFLHLKSGVAYLGDNSLVVGGECRHAEEFSSFNIIATDDDETYAANLLYLNETVVMASGYPKLKSKLQERGFPITELKMSEFEKLDGGLSCLSLRF